jgi:imidazolonepropionase-like amidohydrolase
MEILVDAGYTVEEAVCCATSDPSRLLGLRGEMGQIKKGMEGTFVVVAGPPKTLLRRMGQPEKVFVQGRLVASGGLPILSG